MPKLFAAVLFALLPAAATATKPIATQLQYGAVELQRDRWGTPHVFADTDLGAFYGLGYATAADRGLQMHFNLRLIQGRAAEVLGAVPHPRKRNETTLTHDRRMRTFGFYRAARAAVESLDAENRALLEAYSRGVNDYFARHGHDLHPGFAAADLRPEPWTAADCVASWWNFAQYFGTDGTRDLLRYRRLQEGGRSNAVPAPDDGAAVIRAEDLDQAWLGQVEAFLQEQGYGQGQREKAGDAGPSFSHAWVADGRLSGTGAAVLVSDPQTPVANPSLLYEYHIKGASFDARGVGVPGAPLMLIGFSRTVAWGMTALGADQADLFRLHTDAERPDQYRFEGEWLAMEVLHDTLRVKDGEAVPLKIRLTRWGPVCSEFSFARPQDGEVALRRVPLDGQPETTWAAALGMLRAADVDAFGQALHLWRFPSVNALWGDSGGRIGYMTALALPLRSPEAPEGGRAAHDGGEARYDWRGYVPPALLPQKIDPRRGLFYSGNHRPIDSAYPVELGNMTGALGHTLRSWRLAQLLEGVEALPPAAMRQVHFDAVNPARRAIVGLGYSLQEDGAALPDGAVSALRHLRDWYEAGSAMDLRRAGTALAGCINLSFRAGNSPLAWEYGGGQTGLVAFLRRAEQRVDDGETLPADEASFVAALLADAWRQATEQWGDDPAAWTAAARMPASEGIPYLKGLSGFAPAAGDGPLAWNAPPLYCTDGNTMLSQRSQAYTQYVPLHAVDRAQSLLPPGASEDPRDPRRLAGAADWAAGRLRPAPLSAAALEPFIIEKQVLLD